MAKKQMAFKTKGMNRDTTASAFSSDFVFENRNLRLSTNESNTLMSWVTEKGTSPIILQDAKTGSGIFINGTVIGTAVLNDYLVLFVQGDKDCIYRLQFNNEAKTSMSVTLLYKGTLHFSVDNPIEAIVSYEADNIQKVYWVDGINQPRVINIMQDYAEEDTTGYNPFDFIPQLKLNETVKVKKLVGANGTFAPGVIQYAFTYYNKNGQESCIFHTTPLLYISYNDRGAAPDAKVSNAFKITVSGVDNHFEYLRIYSIQRTSMDDTPFTKRVQDICLKGITNDTVEFTDNGTSGDEVDPTELLYKGGEEIIASTLEQKDNTLFLGNIKETRTFIEKDFMSDIKEAVSLAPSYRKFYPVLTSADNYKYGNQLTSYDSAAQDNSVPCNGFKVGNTYRLGVQFQYRTGKWSDPIFIADKPLEGIPRAYETADPDGTYCIAMPSFKGSITKEEAQALINKGYKKIRGVVALPNVQDRVVLCQGVVCPTLYLDSRRSSKFDTVNDDSVGYEGDLYAQSSWFFRTLSAEYPVLTNGAVSPKGEAGRLPYANGADNDAYSADTYDPSGDDNIRRVEVQGSFKNENQFTVDTDFLTLHTPDAVFDNYLSLADFAGTGYRQVGQSWITRTFSDIDIQTTGSTVSSTGGGFVHKSFNTNRTQGIVSGPFYDDFIVDDWDEKTLHRFQTEKSSCKWMVYCWNKMGSLNNDITRSSNLGVPTAVLKKKVISNLRFGETSWNSTASNTVWWDNKVTPQIFNSDQLTIVKVDGKIYMGNIDTIMIPDKSDGMYFSFGDDDKDNPHALTDKDIVTDFGTSSPVMWKVSAKESSDGKTTNRGVYKYYNSSWSKENYEGSIGDKFPDLTLKKEGVRITYKSTPHMVLKLSDGADNKLVWEQSKFPVVEVVRKVEAGNPLYNGDSEDSLRESNWLPCGGAVTLSSDADTSFDYLYGDNYFQRWDCLKTYPFTNEDMNQVVEIGSFMLETYVNIDGRYDRNRGQIDNTNMTPVNFNLYNPVYSQKDNFFTYKIADEDTYTNVTYPNQLTWSLTKTSGADVDAWTNINMGSALELDGDKGSLTKLIRFNDQIMAFQDKGISQIMYNENVQVQSTQGVPIELANSGKVQGKRYLSNTVGCSDKWSITMTPTGIYFIDSNTKDIYLFTGQLGNLSQMGGFNTWCKQNLPSSGKLWNPTDKSENYASYYDPINQDILFINTREALAYSEVHKAFTSFYDYEDAAYFLALRDTGIWLRNHGGVMELWKHQAGDYCNFFGKNKPYSTIIIANQEPLMSKVFTNIEFIANVETTGLEEITGATADILPFDFIEAWDEYQHGQIDVKDARDKFYMLHNLLDRSNTAKRKFRVWRCDLPRDNAEVNQETESSLGISRDKKRIFDWMRNQWLYIKLQKNAAPPRGRLNKAEVHDLVVTYYI